MASIVEIDIQEWRLLFRITVNVALPVILSISMTLTLSIDFSWFPVLRFALVVFPSALIIVSCYMGVIGAKVKAHENARRHSAFSRDHQV